MFCFKINCAFNHRLDQSGDYVIYQSLVPIPKCFYKQINNNNFFRYKYVVKVGERKYTENLVITSHKWRMIQITKEMEALKGENITYNVTHLISSMYISGPTDHFDTVVLPNAREGWGSFFRGLITDTKAEVIYMGTIQSLKVFFSYAVKMGWLTMETFNFAVEAHTKAGYLSSVFSNLKIQLYKPPHKNVLEIFEMNDFEKVVE